MDFECDADAPRGNGNARGFARPPGFTSSPRVPRTRGITDSGSNGSSGSHSNPRSVSISRSIANSGSIAIARGIAGNISDELLDQLMRRSIKAETNGSALEPKAKVAAGTKVTFSAVPAEQAIQVKWSADPAASVTFDSAEGQQVTGTVNAAGAVLAEHPQMGKARFELTV